MIPYERKPKRDLKFYEYNGHITDKMLEEYYSDKFKMFANEQEARDYAATQPHAWVSKITNYHDSDIFYEYKNPGTRKAEFIGLRVKENAEKITVGWLVSLVKRDLKPKPPRKHIENY